MIYVRPMASLGRNRPCLGTLRDDRVRDDIQRRLVEVMRAAGKADHSVGTGGATAALPGSSAQ